MTKEEKQIEVFVEMARNIAEEWTRKAIRGADTHPEYENKMYLLHNAAKGVFAQEDDRPAGAD